jgi:hypothetical protein
MGGLTGRVAQAASARLRHHNRPTRRNADRKQEDMIEPCTMAGVKEVILLKLV